MKLFRFIKSRTFFINALIIIVFVILLVLAVFRFLKVYTHHGESLTVPDFKGFTLEQVKEKCEEKGLAYQVIDSLYKPGVPYFTVLDQKPKPASKVKVNRTMYLVISSDKPLKVKLPDIIDVSLRVATKKIKNKDLEIGELEYVPHFAPNLVLKVKKDGREIKPGAYIKKGSKIDLVLGDGLSSDKDVVPNLIGVSYEDVMFVLAGNGFNIGVSIFDTIVKDSSQAIIYKQFPLHNPEKKIALGEAIDIWLTNEEKFKAMKLSIDESLKDSLENLRTLKQNSTKDNAE